MNEFCGFKGIKREFSVAKTPQQNRVAERKNRTLIEVARIEMVKIHTDNNVADLLTKDFDVSRFNFLVASIWNGYTWQSQALRHHGGGPAQTRSERVLEKPNEPPLSEGHTSGSGKGRMEHQFELTANVPLTPYDSPFLGSYTPGNDEDSYASREKVPTDQELLEKMLNLQLEAEEESTMAFELIKFIKLMLEE
ncbi:putative ribonuclease H-like domain-containing protein [Tanacetum coccineum]